MKAVTYMLLGEPPPRKNHNINKEHPMDWIVWILILLVAAAIFGGVIALIVLGIRRLVRGPRPKGPTYGSDHS